MVVVTLLVAKDDDRGVLIDATGSGVEAAAIDGGLCWGGGEGLFSGLLFVLLLLLLLLLSSCLKSLDACIFKAWKRASMFDETVFFKTGRCCSSAVAFSFGGVWFEGIVLVCLDATAATCRGSNGSNSGAPGVGGGSSACAAACESVFDCCCKASNGSSSGVDASLIQTWVCEAVCACRVGRPRRIGTISGSSFGGLGSFSKMADGLSLLAGFGGVETSGEDWVEYI